jgi:hypothetical protein
LRCNAASVCVVHKNKPPLYYHADPPRPIPGGVDQLAPGGYRYDMLDLGNRAPSPGRSFGELPPYGPPEPGPEADSAPAHTQADDLVPPPPPPLDETAPPPQVQGWKKSVCTQMMQTIVHL